MELPTVEILDNVNNSYFEGDEIKVYPYRMINSNKTDKIAENNSYALVSLANRPFGNTAGGYGYKYDPNKDWKLQKDDDGNPYFTIIPSQDIVSSFDTAQGTSSNQHKIINQIEVTGSTDNMIVDKSEYINAFTIGKPFDPKSVANKTQAIYFNSDENIGMDEEDDNDDLFKENNAKSVRFINSNQVESQYMNFEFKWIANKELMFNSDVKLFNIEIGMTGASLLAHDGVRIKTFSSDSYLTTTVNNNTYGRDIEDNVPLMANIAKVNDNVSIYVPWFDNNIALSYSPIPNILGDPSNRNIINLFADREDAVPEGADKAVKVILDLIEINLAFTSNFLGFERYKFSDIGSGAKQISPADVSKVIGNQYFAGNSGDATTMDTHAISVQDAESKSAAVLSNEVFQRWAHVNNVQTDSQLFKCMRQAICALSKYINSDFAIAQGSNDFNKAFLPWTAEITTPLELVKVGSGDPRNVNVLYKLKENIVIDIKSEFFAKTKSGDWLQPAPNMPVSEIKTISTDRTLTIPTIPTIITEGNISTFPADINTTSADTLKYLWLIMGHNDTTAGSMETLFNGEDRYNPSDTKQYTFTTPSTNVNGYIPTSILNNGFVPDINNNDDIKRYIAQTFAWTYDLPINSDGSVTGVTVNDIGTIRESAIGSSIPFTQDSENPYIPWTRKGFYQMIQTTTFAGLPDAAPISPSVLKKDVLETMLKDITVPQLPNTYFDKGYYDINNDAYYGKQSDVLGWAGMITGSSTGDEASINFNIKTFGWEDTKITLTSKIVKAITRKNTFNKNSWRNWIGSKLPILLNDTFLKVGIKGVDVIDWRDMEEISITALWNDKIVLKPFADDKETIEFEAFNKKDQTQTVTKILFL